MEIWTRDTLHKLVSERFQNMKFIAVSNREPYIHTKVDGRIRCGTAASGLTTALDPILRASGGVWVAHGSGSADRNVVDAGDRIRVPPDSPSYTLRRVWLSERIEKEYYYGLANRGLWPLCHAAFHRPRFTARNWASYREANELFADAILEEAGDGSALVFIQDYHLALLPRMLKRRNPRLTIAQFWHIPWPNRETFRAFPWKEELLDGMLGNDLLGFHLQYHCANFLETIERSIEACVDTEHATVTRSGHKTTVRSFPISIDFEERGAMAAHPNVAWPPRNGCRNSAIRRRFWELGLTESITPREFPTDCKRSIDCWRITPRTLAGSGFFRWVYQAGLRSKIMNFSIANSSNRLRNSTGNGGALPGSRSLSFTGTSISKRLSPCT